MPMNHGRRFLRDVGLCAVTVVIASCSEGTGWASDACPQTHEFGNFGCARVQGTVRNAAGEALAGARVSLGPPSGAPNTYDSPSIETDATGQYDLEIHDYGPRPTAAPADTVPMYVRAFLIGGPTLIADSVLVDMIFAPVGEVPELVEADIRLGR